MEFGHSCIDKLESVIEVSNGEDIGSELVLNEPWKLKFKISDFKPDEHTKWDSPIVCRGGLEYRISVGRGHESFMTANLITESTFKGSVELTLKNQQNSARDVRCCGQSGTFMIKPDVIRNPSNGWVQNGVLIVEAEIRELVRGEVLWNPAPVLAKNMLALLESGASADVVFIVQGQRFPAHSCILSLTSTVLAMGEDEDDADSARHVRGCAGGHTESHTVVAAQGPEEVCLDGVAPAVFKEVLAFIYTDQKTDVTGVWATQTLELLEAADRFHVPRLKLVAELDLCRQNLNVERVAEMLVFAEAHSCPQLKETCLCLWSEHSTAIMESESWMYVAQAPSLLTELLVALNTKLTGNIALQGCGSMSSRSSVGALSGSGTSTPLVSPSRAKGKGRVGIEASPTSVTKSPSAKRDSRSEFHRRLRAMRVGELRRSLQEYGLLVDGGPREVLESRLLERQFPCIEG